MQESPATLAAELEAVELELFDVRKLLNEEVDEHARTLKRELKAKRREAWLPVAFLFVAGIAGYVGFLIGCA
jgi:hypothetical protein